MGEQVEVRHVGDYMDLIYSPDDGGWYFQKYLPGKGSQVSGIFDTSELAMEAYFNGPIEWRD